MYAIIDTEGFQHRVSPGDTIKMQLLASDEKSVTFSKVLLVAKDDGTIIGNPYVANASVKAEVVGNNKDKKVIVFKKKPRKGYKKTVGHRQQYSLVKIQDIVVGG
jgi:large subunit ribosomal protein L21